MDLRIISNHIELYIQIGLANASKANYESGKLITKLIEPTPSNFQIGVNVELWPSNSNSNLSNHDWDNYGLHVRAVQCPRAWVSGLSRAFRWPWRAWAVDPAGPIWQLCLWPSGLCTARRFYMTWMHARHWSNSSNPHQKICRFFCCWWDVGKSSPFYWDGKLVVVDLIFILLVSPTTIFFIQFNWSCSMRIWTWLSFLDQTSNGNWFLARLEMGFPNSVQFALHFIIIIIIIKQATVILMWDHNLIYHFICSATALDLILETTVLMLISCFDYMNIWVAVFLFFESFYVLSRKKNSKFKWWVFISFGQGIERMWTDHLIIDLSLSFPQIFAWA